MADVKNFSPIRMTASSEDAAVAQALQIVGVAREDVSVEVVSRDAKGVTVRVSPRGEEEPAAAAAAPEASGPQEPEATPAAEAEIEIEEAGQDEDEVAPFADGDYAAEDEASDAEAGDGDEADEPAPRPAFVPRPVDPALQEQAVATAQDFLERMGMNAEVRAVPDEGGDADETPRLLLDIEGEDVGILIGKHGQTLQAFQYLLNITLNNRRALETGGGGDEPRENSLRIVVDAGGYRSRRAGSLQQVARDAAARACRDRRPIRMEPMPAHERRLVHMALQNDSSVTTSSEGREPVRYIVISPAGYRAPEGGERSFARSYGRGGGRGYGGNRAGGRRGGGYGRDSR